MTTSRRLARHSRKKHVHTKKPRPWIVGKGGSAHEYMRTEARTRAQWLQSVLSRYEGPLVRYAAGICGDLGLGQDVVQEAFLALWRADEGSPDESGVRPWLFTVVRNRALDVRRREGRMQSTASSEPTIGSSADQSTAGPGEICERREAVDAVGRAMEGLPEAQQEAVRLRFADGLSYREIAEVTGHTVSNVGWMLHVALKHIRQHMQQTEVAR